MTSLADSVNRLGTPEYIQFTDYKQTPLPVCSIVSDRKGLTFYKKWKQADTAQQCHNNAFIIYDRHRRLEDAHMKGEKIIKTAGLRMRFSDILNTDVNRFNGKPNSGEATYTNVPPNGSVEFFGFFLPSVKGIYKFSLENIANEDYKIWLGDVACHEYLDENANIEIEMFKNEYFAIRIQYFNPKSTDQFAKIQVVGPDNNIIASPNLLTLRNENQSIFNRNLLYYGLVSAGNTNQNLYYCYFNRRSDYREIRRTKGINVIVRALPDILTDKNPPAKRGQKNAGESDNLKLNAKSDNIHDITINNARYAAKSGQAYEILRSVPDKNRLFEMVKVQIGTDTVTTKKNGKTVTKQVPKFKYVRVPRIPVPMTTIKERVVPPALNVTSNVKDIIAKDGDVNINPYTYNSTLGKDPAPGLSKLMTINYTSSISDKAKINKNITVNDKCQVSVNYDGIPEATATLFTAGGVCNDKRIVLTDEGTLTVNGGMWSSLSNKIRKDDKPVANKTWLKQGHPDALSEGGKLETLVSSNGKFKAVFANGKLKCYYSVDAYGTDDAGQRYSLNTPGSDSPQALYLYRPNYSELGGKTYVTVPGEALVEIRANRLDPSIIGYGRLPGYPLQSYMDTSGNCKEICDNSPDCGNFINYGKNRCLIDQRSELRPTYSTRKPTTGPLSQEKIPSIYIKKPIMNGKTLTIGSTGYYSEYEIKCDPLNIPQVNTAPLSNQAIYNYNLYDPIMSSQKDGFSDIPPRFSNKLPDAPETSVEEGRIEDLQTIMFQQNVLYSVSSIAALSFLVGAIVLARK
jgi:hypothetical protein